MFAVAVSVVLEPISKLVPAEEESKMLHPWKYAVTVPGPLIVAVVDAELVEEKVIDPVLLVHSIKVYPELGVALMDSDPAFSHCVPLGDVVPLPLDANVT